jgi:hypothetical protein
VFCQVFSSDECFFTGSALKGGYAPDFSLGPGGPDMLA